MKTVCALPRRLFTRSRSVSNVMYPSPSIASAFNRRVAEVGNYFLGVALGMCSPSPFERSYHVHARLDACIPTVAQFIANRRSPSGGIPDERTETARL